MDGDFRARPAGSRKRTHRRIGWLAGIAAAGLLAAGCSSGSGGSGSRVEKPDLVVAAVPDADSAGLYVTAQQGFFKSEGLNVKIVNVQSSSKGIIGMQKGTVDITVGGYVSFIEDDAVKDDNLKIIAPAAAMQTNCQVVLTLPNSPISSIAQLRGKRVAVNSVTNIGAILVKTALEEAGVPENSVQLVQIPFAGMANALSKHEVDAAYMAEPYASSAEQSIGAVQLFDTDKGATLNLPISGVGVTSAWLKKYPKTATAFVAAMAKGQADADSNRSAVEQAMKTYGGVSPRTAAIMAIDNYPLGSDPIPLQRVANAMLQFGQLKTAYNVKTMVKDPS